MCRTVQASSRIELYSNSVQPELLQNWVKLQQQFKTLLLCRIIKQDGRSLEPAAAVQHQQEDHCGAGQPHHLRRVQLAQDGEWNQPEVLILTLFRRSRLTMSSGELVKMEQQRTTTHWSVFSTSFGTSPSSTLSMSDRWFVTSILTATNYQLPQPLISGCLRGHPHCAQAWP